MTRHLVEPATWMIRDYIQANIGQALIDINASLAVSEGNLGLSVPKPREYFIAANYMALQPPSVFIVCSSIDFKKERGANFIFATADYEIATVVEGQTTYNTTIMAWRYVAALSQILDNKGLTNTDNTFSIKIVVERAEFSEDYRESVSTQPGDPAQKWRKGFLLRCGVEFYEAL